MKIENEFIPFEQALALKELGFDENCLGYFFENKLYTEQSGDVVKYFKSNLNAPLYQQAFRWFREKHNLIPNIPSIYTDETHTEVEFWFWIGNYQEDLDEEVFYGTYEEAELECLKKLIKIVKNKKL